MILELISLKQNYTHTHTSLIPPEKKRKKKKRESAELLILLVFGVAMAKSKSKSVLCRFTLVVLSYLETWRQSLVTWYLVIERQHIAR